MAFPSPPPSRPPDISTGAALFTPLPLPLRDSRWLAIRDQAGVRLRYSGDGIVPKVDQWVNHAIRYQREPIDTWSPPAETLKRGFGDCEDIALLKRAILLRSGAPEACVHFVLAEDLIGRETHAFLTVFEDRWSVLDSRNSASLPVEQLRDYRPISAFSGDRAWMYGRKVR